MSVTRIAEKAGVSIATVSRVLNNSRNVDVTLAESVRQAARDLNLDPPRPRKTRVRAVAPPEQCTIAMVTLGQSVKGWFEVPVIANVVAEVSRSAQSADIGVLVTEMPDPHQLSPVLRRPGVQGAIVLIGGGLGMKDLGVLCARMPVVRIMGSQPGPLTADYVDADNAEVGRLAGAYLIERGVKRLAFLSTEPSWDLIRLRAQGFLGAAHAAGLVAELYGQAPTSPYYNGAFVAEESLEALVGRLAQRAEGPIGLFIPQDEQTAAVDPLLRKHGLVPGKDVIVISCDNEQVRLNALFPRPATVELGTTLIARQAVHRLRLRIAGLDEPPVRLLIQPRVVDGD